jgi:hypothetical protein
MSRNASSNSANMHVAGYAVRQKRLPVRQLEEKSGHATVISPKLTLPNDSVQTNAFKFQLLFTLIAFSSNLVNYCHWKKLLLQFPASVFTRLIMNTLYSRVRKRLSDKTHSLQLYEFTSFEKKDKVCMLGTLSLSVQERHQVLITLCASENNQSCNVLSAHVSENWLPIQCLGIP